MKISAGHNTGLQLPAVQPWVWNTTVSLDFMYSSEVCLSCPVCWNLQFILMFGSSVEVPDFGPWSVTTPEDLCCYSSNVTTHFSFTSFDAFQGDRLGHFHVVIFLCLWRITNTLFSHQEVLYALLWTDFYREWLVPQCWLSITSKLLIYMQPEISPKW